MLTVGIGLVDVGKSRLNFFEFFGRSSLKAVSYTHLQATKNKNAPIFPEYTMEFVMNELDLFEKRDGDVFYITEETKEQLREIAPFWENNNLRARGERCV